MVKKRKSIVVQTEPNELDSIEIQTEAILVEEHATQTMPWRLIKKERIPLLHEQHESEEYVPGAALQKLLGPVQPAVPSRTPSVSPVRTREGSPSTVQVPPTTRTQEQSAAAPLTGPVDVGRREARVQPTEVGSLGVMLMKELL